MPFLIVRNDITTMNVDAIVNAANNSLLGGGGVDGRIHRVAGPQLLAECKTLDGCATGKAKITKGYNLPCRYVIHTVGPVWSGGSQNEPELLTVCYRNSLELAKEYKCRSVAFPLISSGAYGYPKDKAMRIAIDTITDFLFENEMLVYLVVFDKKAFSLSGKLFDRVESYIGENYVDLYSDSYAENQRRYAMAEMAEPMLYSAVAGSKMKTDQPDWDNMLNDLDDSFSETLLKIIETKNLKESQVYKKANIDRKLFSKIKNDKNHKPEKGTALAFAIALELDIDQTKDLLARAGLALSKSNKFDVVVSFFIENKIYDIFEINEVLFNYDLPLIGG